MNGFDSGIHARRRALFMEQLGAAAAVIPAAALATHHADCEWPFRQDSDFFYLTGFDEPDAVALLLPHRPEASTPEQRAEPSSTTKTSSNSTRRSELIAV